jgi:hypothetical protein
MISPTRRHLLKTGLALAACDLVGFNPSAGAFQGPSARPTFYPGAMPSRSDVVMSVGSLRPDYMDQLKGFHATRCEWMYITDASVVAAMKKVVQHVGLAVSPARRIAKDAGAAHDIDGTPIVAPWMKAAGNNTPWNSIFKSATRDSIFSAVKSYVQIGADSVQFDDPAMEYSVVRFAGGDFSPEALDAFRSYCQSSRAQGCGELAAEKYDMGNWVRRRAGTAPQIDWNAFKKQHGSDPAWQAWTSFMAASSAGFVSSIRQFLHSQSRPLPLSLNATPLPLPEVTYLLDSADYLFAEINELRNPAVMLPYHATAAAWQLPFVQSVAYISTPIMRWSIALAYALGDVARVPYDEWTPGRSKDDRYFGTVSDYGSLFEFVRNNATYFDDYDEVADVALVFDESTIPKATCYQIGYQALVAGASIRFVVVRPKGNVIGAHSSVFQPQVAVGVNVSPSKVKEIYPSIPSIALGDLNRNGINPALMRTLRVVTPDAANIIAVPRINKRSGMLLVHVVDARQSSQGFNDTHFVDLLVPEPYRSYVDGVQNALLLRPGAGALKRPVSVNRSNDIIRIRLPLAGISGWGVLVLDRHLS